MKLHAANFLLVMLCGSAIAQQTATVTQPDTLRGEFPNIAEQWVAAYNGTDAKQLEPLYTKDAQYISGHVAGLVADGLDRLIANFQTGMNMGGHVDRLDVLTVNTSCDLATVLCAYSATNGGQKARGRTLLVLRKIDGKWLIALHVTVV